MAEFKYAVTAIVPFEHPHDLEVACSLILDQADKFTGRPGPLGRACALMRAVVEELQQSEKLGGDDMRRALSVAGGERIRRTSLTTTRSTSARSSRSGWSSASGGGSA